MTEVLINNRWPLILPEHRAARPQWTEPPYWEAARLDSMHDNIRPTDLVLDIGTEEGDLSALFAQWAGGIILSEPNPKVWPNVRAIFEANGLTGKVVECLVGFVGDVERGAFDLGSLDQRWPKCAYGDLIGDHGFCNLLERPDMPATTIDALASKGLEPTVITMDTEGSELNVLRGGEAYLRSDRPLVYVSVHRDFMLAMYGTTPEELNDFMWDCGYASHWINTDHEEHWLFYPDECTISPGGQVIRP